jgi:putative Mg2+ transporter-C (MgtC) family protein
MLVSLGSALIIIVSAYGFDQVIRPSRVVLDPSRIAAQVVSGIGFLGAGTILRRDERVLGLTTAASTWAVAAIGLAAGAGLYFAAVAATAMILLTLAGIKPLEDHIVPREGRRTLSLVVAQEGFSAADVEAAIRQQGGLELKCLQVQRGGRPDELHVAVTVGQADDAKLLALVDRLHALMGVRKIDYEAPRG